MGDTLSKPVLDKYSQELINSYFKVGASGMQGWRRGMEDAHTTVLSMPEDPSCAFFAVYDGHCGEKIARYCSENLHGRVAASAHFKRGEWEEAMNEGFLGTDVDILSSELRNDPSGCTAVSCLITTKGEIVCANAGDSRAVLSRGGKAIPLSFDHKPTNDVEMKRIQSAGGYVTAGRVNGNLALSRAIGDFTFKQNTQLRAEEQMVCAQPEIIRERLIPEDEFIVLACDGIWDVMSNEEVVAHVREELQHSQDLAAICEKTFEKCLAPRASGVGCDNMTMIIVQFTDEYKAKVKSNTG